MKKLLVVGMIILMVGMSVPSTGINIEKTSIVIFDGNTLYVGGSGPGNYTKIQDAIDDASDGDTVFVYNGTYYEYNIIVDKSITLIGEDKNTTILDGEKTDNHILFLTGCNIIVKGFTVQNTGYAKDGIAINSANNIVIIDCNFYDNADSGISAFDSSNTFILHCEFYGNGWGICIYGWDAYAYNNSISFCTFGYSEDVEIGYLINTSVSNCVFFESEIVQLWPCHGSTYSNCEFNGGFDGIKIRENVHDIKVKNCTFLNCRSTGLDFFYGSPINLIVANCTFENCDDNGICFGSLVEDSSISGCKFLNNTYNGIYFCAWAINVSVSRCHFEGNEDGIDLWWRSHSNKFSENNFINNNRHIHRESFYFIMFNSYSHNYYDDWIGFGPYHIMGLLYWDWHPAKEPYDI